VKAFVYSDWGCLEVQDVPAPEIGRGEALIRVEACGICGSELECFKSRSPRRKPPLILGHEFCGAVELLNDGDADIEVGQRVVVNSVVSCGRCYPCLRGDRHLCAERQVFGMHRPGAVAQFVAAPIDHVYPMPHALDPVLAALVEPAVCGIHLINMMPDVRYPSAVVIGAGPMGLMALQSLRALRDARVLVADINEARLEVARDLGAEEALNPNKEDLVAACVKFSRQDGVDMCIDAVGAASTKCVSLDVIRPGGACGWIGLFDDGVTLSSYRVVLSEKSILGTYAGVRSDFECAANLLAEGRIRGGDWVKVYAIEQSVMAFERMLKAHGDDLKAVILPQGV